MVEFTVDIDPMPAPRPRLSRFGAYNPKSYTQFKNNFRQLAIGYAPADRITGPVKLDVIFCIKRPKTVKRAMPHVKPDLDNFVKSVKDSLGDFWIDDAQVCSLTAEKRYGERGSISVKILSISQ